MSDLPSGWAAAEFPAVTFFQEGPGLRKYQFRERGIPFLNIRTFVDGHIDRTLCKSLDSAEVEKKYQHFLVEAGDILIAISGSIGKWAIAREQDLPLLLNTSIMRFRPLSSEVLERRYLFWFLRSPLSRIKRGAPLPAQLKRTLAHRTLRTLKFFFLPPLNSGGSWRRSVACPRNPNAPAISSTTFPGWWRNTSRRFWRQSLLPKAGRRWLALVR